MTETKPIGASFRDPSGSVFEEDGVVYRRVNLSYQSNYDCLLDSGLYESLVARQMLVSHRESSLHNPQDFLAYKILCPEQIPFISYPYEWSFSQLKDAALLTLDIQKLSLAHNMILKDASAYNVQFLNGKPILIDTLSFEKYEEGQAWVAYKQFCQHFLAPLLLMSYKDIRLSQLLRVHIDGIPLDLAATLLPKRSVFNVGSAMHLHLHARAQRRYAGKAVETAPARRNRLSKKALMNIGESLRTTITGLKWDHGFTSWTGYYDGESYETEGFDNKQQLVSDYINIANPKSVWDLGANTGVFSRIASSQGIFTVSMDNDPGVVEANYLQTKQQKETDLHPLLIDLANPSGSIGWGNIERDSLAKRCKADCILALALIHHLVISNNVPLDRVAAYFASLSDWIIIEFVPKSDKQVKKLLVSREDIFPNYTKLGFEAAFSEEYEIVRSQQIDNSDRILYLLYRKPREA